ERIPRALDERAELWRAELSSRRTLIILDDVTGPEQVSPLLPRTGDCLVLVTSRRRFRDLGQARKLALQNLAEDDAVALFTQIAGRQADRDPDHVAKVSHLCGCLPLAIRLAASRLRSGAVATLSDLLDELDDPTGGQGQASELSHRIQAAFELSYRWLPPTEQ